jgi:hypothetical protein
MTHEACLYVLNTFFFRVILPPSTMTSDTDSRSDTSFRGYSAPLSPPNFFDSEGEDSNLTLQPEISTTPIVNRTELLPPSSGPLRSSPITGNAAEKAAGRQRKAQKKRIRTLQKKRETQIQQEEALKRTNLEEVLEFMGEHNITLWDFLVYVFNPEYAQGRTRHHQFFSTQGRLTQLLNWWTSSKNRSRMARREIDEWVQGYIQNKVAQEARAVTNS